MTSVGLSGSPGKKGKGKDSGSNIMKAGSKKDLGNVS